MADREEDFSAHNPRVVSNTWGTQAAAWHQRALTHPDKQAERPNTVLQRRVRAFRRSIWHKSTSSLFLGRQPVAVKSPGFILSHRAIRKGCKSPQRHLFMHRWASLSCSSGPRTSGRRDHSWTWTRVKTTEHVWDCTVLQCKLSKGRFFLLHLHLVRYFLTQNNNEPHVMGW